MSVEGATAIEVTPLMGTFLETARGRFLVEERVEQGAGEGLD